MGSVSLHFPVLLLGGWLAVYDLRTEGLLITGQITDSLAREKLRRSANSLRNSRKHTCHDAAIEIPALYNEVEWIYV